MDEEDAQRTIFTTLWGTYCYRVMPFGLKKCGETYMKAMTIMFHYMTHKEIEVYVDDVIIKSKKKLIMCKMGENSLKECKDMISSLIKQNVHLEFHTGNFWVWLSVEGESNWILPK